MRVGIPREIKTLEGRVALVPAACAELVAAGHEVLVEAGAGLGAGHADPEYQRAGARVAADADALYGEAQLVVKVKEPQDADLDRLRADHLLFCYLHLAAAPALTQRLAAIGLTAIGFETVAIGRSLPLLAPMSDIAGRLAIQIGTQLLHAPQGGRGLLLGGVSGAPRGRVAVLGAGVAGSAAVKLAAALGAEVVAFDRRRDPLEAMRAVGPNVTGLYAYRDRIAECLRQTDLLVGAVLVPGARAPKIVSRDMVAAMPAGSVVVDISVDQGGCVETIRPTTYAEPTYKVGEVTHFGVTNMPGAVPRTASEALSAVLLPWVLRLAQGDWRDDPALAGGINVDAGRVVHPALRDQAA